MFGVLWFLYVRDYPPGAAPARHPVTRARTPWRNLLTDKNIGLLTIGFSLLGYFEYIFFYWIYYYLGEIRHLARARALDIRPSSSLFG